MVSGVMQMTLKEARNKKRSKMKKRYIFRASVLVLLLAAVIYALAANVMKDKQVYSVGDEAPDFQLQQIKERNEMETIRLSDLRGKGVMLNFWATYCKPCEAEMPYMEQLYPEYKDKGIEIIAVNLQEAKLVVNRFVDRYDLTFPIPHDNRGTIRDLYQIGRIPSTLFINADGIIVEKVEGALTLELLEGYFNQILPE